jgi:hypothetical protein
VTGTYVLKNAEGAGYSMLLRGQIARVEGDLPAVLSNDIPNLDFM